MPLWTYADEHGHTREVYEHHPDDKGCRTIICEECGAGMSPMVSYGHGLTAMEEGKPVTIWNAGHEPVTVRSWRQYDKLLKSRGLAQAGERRGMKGAWL